jgi:hypothetical protein
MWGGGGDAKLSMPLFWASKTQEFLFLSLQHPNNRLENIAVFFYLTFFHLLAKKYSYEEKILEGHLPPPPPLHPQVTPMTLDVL